MNKTVEMISVGDLRELAPTISFPEYQRESTVWDRRGRQRLIDSMIRGFDISAFYFYRTEEGELECIDGRQRITTIFSFAGDLADEVHEPFPLLFDNEIAPEQRPDLSRLNGKTYATLRASADEQDHEALRKFEKFEITAVILSDSRDPFEFNLQFTRLNLGAIINSGEKLNAMEGDMHDLCFQRIGKHEFLRGISIPTRRFASEQTAAQFLSEIYALHETGEFRRIRHFDLQKFFKQKFRMNAEDNRLASQIDELLTRLATVFGADLALLRNRALTVSLVLLAWVESEHIEQLPAFWKHFAGRLSEQLARVKEFQAVDERYRWLVDFQKDVTQASAEKPAVTRRHERLVREFERFRDTGSIKGDT